LLVREAGKGKRTDATIRGIPTTSLISGLPARYRMQTGRQRCFECLKSLLDLALHVQTDSDLHQVEHGAGAADRRLLTQEVTHGNLGQATDLRDSLETFDVEEGSDGGLVAAVTAAQPAGLLDGFRLFRVVQETEVRVV